MLQVIVETELVGQSCALDGSPLLESACDLPIGCGAVKQPPSLQMLRHFGELSTIIRRFRCKLVNVRPLEHVARVHGSERIHLVVGCQREKSSNAVELQFLKRVIHENVLVFGLQTLLTGLRDVLPTGVDERHIYTLGLESVSDGTNPLTRT